MALDTYRKKRDFKRTAEPKGKLSKGKRHRFVVHEHAASRLHYDFRLEMGGVLKSWAIPKGPSLRLGDKRLAVMVEDHPLDYRTFEGTIPEGNYGAGSVIVWDEGAYEPVDQPSADGPTHASLEQLEKGHLRFVLHGHKLRGQFSLVKLNRGKGNYWLLLKHRDEFARDADVLVKDRSVLSRRTLEEVAEGVPN